MADDDGIGQAMTARVAVRRMIFSAARSLVLFSTLMVGAVELAEWVKEVIHLPNVSSFNFTLPPAIYSWFHLDDVLNNIVADIIMFAAGALFTVMFRRKSRA